MLVPHVALPRPAQWQRWATSRKLRLAGLVAAVLVLLVTGILVLSGGEGREGAEEPASRVQATAPVLSTFANQDGRYELAYPAAWTTSAQGTRTDITSPDRDAIVSIGLSSKGPLRDSSQQFVRLVRRGYSKVSITGRQRDTVAGAPALAVAGEATNPEGTRIRWMGIAVQRKARNVLVAVYTHAAADPAAVLPPTQQIVSSLRFLR